MEIVKSVEEYKSLVAENKKRFEKIQKNCLMMPTAMASFIEEQKLYFEKYEKGLCFFIDEGDYYNLYYYWDAKSDFADLRKEKTVLIEEMNGNGSRDAILQEMEKKFFAAGFQFLKKNYQLETTLEEMLSNREAILEKKAEELKAQGMIFSFCTSEKQEKEIADLWKAHLDETDVPEDDVHFLAHQKMVAVITKGEELCCTYALNEVSPVMLEGSHLVTAPDYYRRGLAEGIALCAYKELLDKGYRKVIAWVSEGNVSSFGLHEKLGFKKNNRTTNQYILPVGY